MSCMRETKARKRRENTDIYIRPCRVRVTERNCSSLLEDIDVKATELVRYHIDVVTLSSHCIGNAQLLPSVCHFSRRETFSRSSLIELNFFPLFLAYFSFSFFLLVPPSLPSDKHEILIDPIAIWSPRLYYCNTEEKESSVMPERKFSERCVIP